MVFQISNGRGYVYSLPGIHQRTPKSTGGRAGEFVKHYTRKARWTDHYIDHIHNFNESDMFWQLRGKRPNVVGVSMFL